MDSQKKFKWLWLEDQPSTINYISTNLFKEEGREFEMFNSIPSLLEAIANIKLKNNEGKIDGYGLILDVYLRGVNKFLFPYGWNGQKIEINIDTDMGYNAGILFYKSMILGIMPSMSQREIDTSIPFCIPPLPVIFLSVMDAESPIIMEDINIIKNRWTSISKSLDPQNLIAKVEFIRKWDMNSSVINRIYQTWNIR